MDPLLKAAIAELEAARSQRRVVQKIESEGGGNPIKQQVKANDASGVAMKACKRYIEDGE